MRSTWSDRDAAACVARYGARCGDDVALRVYTSRLLGRESDLVLHGGGNASVKATHASVLGETVPAIFVKASGHDLGSIEPEGLPGLDLAALQRLRALDHLSEAAMVNELRRSLFDHRAPTPSIETLMHAFIPRRYLDHTHADAILALTNQPDGTARVRDALGADVIVLDYVMAGFDLAKAAAAAYDAAPDARAMILTRHGVLTWGDTAQASYDAMIALVDRAERYLADAARPTRATAATGATSVETARARLARTAPIVRGLLAGRTDDPDRPHRRTILRPLVDAATVAFLDRPDAKALALTPPLTADHLIRTKALPLWLDAPPYDDPEALRAALAAAVDAYVADYQAYVARHASADGPTPHDPLPRVVLLPGLGAFCAGESAAAADVARDITAHALAVKAKIAAMESSYQGLAEHECFEMEYYSMQQAKLAAGDAPPLARTVALVTGAAGAIGSGIVRGLLAAGCHVAATDLAGDPLHALVAELAPAVGPRIAAVPLDVCDPASVAAGFDAIAALWGGVDLAVVNAGAAHVSPLADMDLEAFRRLERINVEGTLLILRESARRFAAQGTGGDVVVISTKNVFAPGAQFGAYSATKAAAHQLARIASLELAAADVRVNMVAPDAVFSAGARKSGLWQTVGPDRMRARGLDEQGLEDYYRQRNLLKAKITAEHVARAVVFFATRQTPTTGATLPVDGGLPDATPR
jgi:rhamnose utilization protein RhaD (predicted bifunctional aldolase and dehydrogenase)/NAD(P)-dependent dehydrogenase (short-subunit alcohol dehydrogenase family)